MDDERVEVVGETTGGRGVAGLVELVEQRLQSLPCVTLVGRLVERLPVGPAHALALPLWQLREQVAQAVDAAVLAV